MRKLIIFKRNLLNQRRKRPNDQSLQDRLKRISKVITVACKLSINNYYHENILENQNNPKKCWRFLNESLGRINNKETNVKDSNGKLIDNIYTKTEVLNKYFLQLPLKMRQSITTSPGDSWNDCKTLNYCRNNFQFQKTSDEQILNILSTLSLSKSPGHDNISPKVLSECKREITPHLVKIFNAIIETSQYPDVLKISKVVHIPKLANANLEEN